MFVTSIVASLRADPRRAFVIDGVGALVSAIALGLVFPSFAGQLGTTRPALSVLAVLPVVFALYDVACVLLRPSRWQIALRVIAVANASYPPISIAVLLWDGVALTALGEAYFAIEIAIVWTLALLQLQTAAARTRAARHDGTTIGP